MTFINYMQQLAWYCAMLCIVLTAFVFLPFVTRAWYEMQDDFSIFHTGNFFSFHFHSILKIFPFHIPFRAKIFLHIPLHTSIPRKFPPKVMHNLYCTLATLSIPLQVVARESKQYGMMHLISYLKHYRNELRATAKIRSA